MLKKVKDHDLLALIKLELQNSFDGGITPLLVELSSSPRRLSNSLDFLADIFFEAGKADLLVSFLLSPKAKTFCRLSLIDHVWRLAKRTDRLNEVYARAGRIASVSSPKRFRTDTYLRQSECFSDPRMRRLLYRLKHSEVPDAKLPKPLFEKACKLSQRIEIDETALDHLFTNSSVRLNSRSDWEDRVRTAHAVDNMTRDRLLSAKQVYEFVDVEAGRNALKQIDSGHGTLMLTCHAGFINPLIAFFKEEVKNGIFMAGSKFGDESVSVIQLRNDSRAGLFAGLKALLNNKIIWLAPDGPLGTKGSCISVLGKQVTVGEGAAFLAYESRCDTAWCIMKRNENRFVPEIVRGPTCQKEDSFSEFKARLLAFYEQMLNDFFAGNLQNLAFGYMWLKIFSDQPTIATSKTGLLEPALPPMSSKAQKKTFVLAKKDQPILSARDAKLATLSSKPSAMLLVKNLATNLRRGDRGGAALALNELMSRPNPERIFKVAEKQVNAPQEKDLLLDLQLEPNSASFGQLWSIAQTGVAAKQSGRMQEFEERIADVLKFKRPVSFRELDYIENFPEFLQKPLMEVKYTGLPEAKRLEKLWPAARRLCGRLTIDRSVFDYLYERNRVQGSSKAAWRRRFKEARCVYHLVLDHKQSVALAQELVDEQAAQSVAQSLAANGATLALFCHVGFVRPTMAFLKTLAPNSLVYGSRDGPTTINAKSNARAALFAGLKALQQNQPVLIASDGTHGNLDGEITLLGQPYKVGTGAAWLAFETKCHLGWLRMRHQQGYFVPELIEGPKRRDGEDYAGFRTRFLHFYEQMMEDQLTGDPADLVLTRKWQKLVIDYCKTRKVGGASDGLSRQPRPAAVA